MSLKACMARESQANEPGRPQEVEMSKTRKGAAKRACSVKRGVGVALEGQGSLVQRGDDAASCILHQTKTKTGTQGPLFFSPSVASVLSSPAMGSPESFSFQSEELFSWRKSEMILAPSKPRSLSDMF